MKPILVNAVAVVSIVRCVVGGAAVVPIVSAEEVAAAHAHAADAADAAEVAEVAEVAADVAADVAVKSLTGSPR